MYAQCIWSEIRLQWKDNRKVSKKTPRHKNRERETKMSLKNSNHVYLSQFILLRNVHLQSNKKFVFIERSKNSESTFCCFQYDRISCYVLGKIWKQGNHIRFYFIFKIIYFWCFHLTTSRFFCIAKTINGRHSHFAFLQNKVLNLLFTFTLNPLVRHPLWQLRLSVIYQSRVNGLKIRTNAIKQCTKSVYIFS